MPQEFLDGSQYISSTRSTCESRAQDLAELFPLLGCCRIPPVARNAGWIPPNAPVLSGPAANSRIGRKPDKWPGLAKSPKRRSKK